VSPTNNVHREDSAIESFDLLIRNDWIVRVIQQLMQEVPETRRVLSVIDDNGCSESLTTYE
jgi:hypothetical protein